MTNIRFSQFSFFEIKVVDHYEVNVVFQDIEHQLRENILQHFLCYRFL